MEEFWYDCVNPTYGEKAKLCYMCIDSFIVYKRTENISLDIMNQTDHYLKEKNKKLIRLLKEKLDGKVMADFAADFLLLQKT